MNLLREEYHETSCPQEIAGWYCELTTIYREIIENTIILLACWRHTSEVETSVLQPFFFVSEYPT